MTDDDNNQLTAIVEQLRRQFPHLDLMLLAFDKGSVMTGYYFSDLDARQTLNRAKVFFAGQEHRFFQSPQVLM